MTPLAAWQNFYVILGSAAGALVGLQFVAMALIADLSVASEEDVDSTEGISATYSTPTIVHFSCVLLLAATMVMPWQRLSGAGVGGIVVGLFGMVYILNVSFRMATQKGYKPVWQDWLHRAMVPFVAYGALVHTSFHIRGDGRYLFGIAAAALLLLITGIHNAWDNVTYIVSMKRRDAAKR